MLIDIATSVAYHGFRRIVMVNGHGSNHPLVEQAARQVTLKTGALCLNISWWQLIADYWNEEVRESGPGGCAHACELETSMYMHVDPEGVRRDRITGAPPDYLDLEGGGRVAEGRPHARLGPGHDRRVDVVDERDRLVRGAGAGDGRERATRLRAQRRATRRDGRVVPNAAGPAAARPPRRAAFRSSCRSGSEHGCRRTLRRARGGDDVRGRRPGGARRRDADPRRAGREGRRAGQDRHLRRERQSRGASRARHRASRARWSCCRHPSRGRRRSWASCSCSRRGRAVPRRCSSTAPCGTSTSSWRSGCPCGRAPCARAGATKDEPGELQVPVIVGECKDRAGRSRRPRRGRRRRRASLPAWRGARGGRGAPCRRARPAGAPREQASRRSTRWGFARR